MLLEKSVYFVGQFLANLVYNNLIDLRGAVAHLSFGEISLIVLTDLQFAS